MSDEEERHDFEDASEVAIEEDASPQEQQVSGQYLKRLERDAEIEDKDEDEDEDEDEVFNSDAASRRRSLPGFLAAST